MRKIRTFAFVGVLFSPNLSMSQIALPADDNDGVEVYDDYCPNTPAGLTVWKPEQVASGEAQAQWVGCAGGKDTAQPGYIPPPRPLPPSASYLQMMQMFETGIDFDISQHYGIYSGRCWKKESDKPYGMLLVLFEDPAGGPALPNPHRMVLGSFNDDYPANGFDNASEEVIQRIKDSLLDSSNEWSAPDKLERGYKFFFNVAGSQPTPEEREESAASIRLTADQKYLSLQFGTIGACYTLKKIGSFDSEEATQKDQQ